MDFVYGINPVYELLRAGNRTAKKIFLAKGKVSKKVEEILAIAKKKGVEIQWKDKRELENFSSSANHQGIVCLTTPFPLTDLISSFDKRPALDKNIFYIILDSINDPMNFGAIIRSSVIAGIDGIIIPKHNSCPITATVAKASAGALEYATIIRETNIVRVIAMMKQMGIWIYGVDEHGKLPYTKVDFTVPIALIFGGEGKGIRDLVKKKCDETIYIPSKGNITTLNVSAAVSVIAFEVARQRDMKVS